MINFQPPTPSAILCPHCLSKTATKHILHMYRLVPALINDKQPEDLITDIGLCHRSRCWILQLHDGTFVGDDSGYGTDMIRLRAHADDVVPAPSLLEDDDDDDDFDDEEDD